jgi:hypothetical protein
MKGMIDKFLLLKDTALNTKIIDNVHLVYSEEMAMALLNTVESTSMMVFPITLSIGTDDDNIQFRVFILDKVNNSYDEMNVLNSWQTSTTALRMIADILNYKEGESVIVDDINVSAFFSNNVNEGDTTSVNVEYMVTSIDAVLDMSYETCKGCV